MSKLTKAERDAFEAAGRAIVERASCEPKRIYIGEGIWWTPSPSFWRTKGGREALREES